jgi:4a-hydroxytetrahydrobiopterin dehydratase
VNTIGAEAEQVNHHPDIDIRYNRVHLSLTSHDSGGITRRDTRMAKRIIEIHAQSKRADLN